MGRQRRNEDFLAYGRRVVERFKPIMDAFAAARVAEERVYELGGACIIASQVAELAKEMTSPFKEGVETACEEIIHRLMEAGAPRLVDTDESRTVRARLTDPTLRAPEGAQP